MSASNTDLVRNSAPNFATTLANSMLVSDTSLTLQSATGLPTATAITLVIDATDPVSGAPTPALKEVVTGTLSGTTVSNLLRGQDGTTAQGHASGANVVMWITTNLWNDFQAAFLANHTQLGAPITGFPLTSPKVTTGINDSNNNKVVGYTATSSAVNNVNIANAATGNSPVFSVTGTDNNIGIKFTPKGTGQITGVVETLTNPYKFSVYRNGAWTVQSALTKVAFDTKEFDTSTNFDVATNNRFVAPIAGFYQFDWCVGMGSVSSGGAYQTQLYKNGSAFRAGAAAVNGGTSSSFSVGSTLVNLAATDYIEIFQAAAGSGTGATGAGSTYFQGFLISAT